jgi:hypothetical protein
VVGGGVGVAIVGDADASLQPSAIPAVTTGWLGGCSMHPAANIGSDSQTRPMRRMEGDNRVKREMGGT